MGQHYKQEIGRETFDAETLSDRAPLDFSPAKSGETEMQAFDEAWLRSTQMFNADGKPFSLFNAKDREDMLKTICIMKAYYNGSPFEGLNPKQGAFGIRWPKVEDLTGNNDTEWGCCYDGAATTTLGTLAWRAGQYAWMQDGDGTNGTQGEATFAAGGAIRLRDSGGGQEWALVLFGVHSYTSDPYVKDVLIELGGDRQAIQQVEFKLRGSKMKVAKFDAPFFAHPTKSFKTGVTLRTADNTLMTTGVDKLAPLGFIILDGTRARDISINRPVAA